jgi:hypothetical protein
MCAQPHVHARGRLQSFRRGALQRRESEGRRCAGNCDGASPAALGARACPDSMRRSPAHRRYWVGTESHDPWVAIPAVALQSKASKSCTLRSTCRSRYFYIDLARRQYLGRSWRCCSGTRPSERCMAESTGRFASSAEGCGCQQGVEMLTTSNRRPAVQSVPNRVAAVGGGFELVVPAITSRQPKSASAQFVRVSRLGRLPAARRSATGPCRCGRWSDRPSAGTVDIPLRTQDDSLRLGPIRCGPRRCIYRGAPWV